MGEYRSATEDFLAKYIDPETGELPSLKNLNIGCREDSEEVYMEIMREAYSITLGDRRNMFP